MAADVLDAGALSLTLDIEPYEEFWCGTADDAQRFGEELRARSPYGRVDISIDPRPWKLFQIPMADVRRASPTASSRRSTGTSSIMTTT